MQSRVLSHPVFQFALDVRVVVSGIDQDEIGRGTLRRTHVFEAAQQMLLCLHDIPDEVTCADTARHGQRKATGRTGPQ
jgi:hypothetical protein